MTTPTLRDRALSISPDTFLAVLLLLSAAFFNGYPLVYSDTGTYISSGFEWHVPSDRPIVYGLFCRLSSFHFSLWLPVAVQAVLVAWLLRMIIQILIPSMYERKIYFGIVAILCIVTSLPWYTGQLMPDIFTAIQIMLIAIVLLQERLKWSHWAGFSVLYILCCTVHFSNLFIGITTLVALAALRGMGGKKQFDTLAFWRKTAIVLAWSIAAFIALPTVNWVVERDFTLGKASYGFLMARFIDDGILKQYLDDNCGQIPYHLCQYKDSLPASSRDWHWDQRSPLYREGGWGANEAEYKAIVWGTLKSPKYLGLHLWKSLVRTPSQLMQNSIGSGLDYKWYRSPESPPYQAVARFFPQELPEYRFCRQNGNLWRQELDFKFFNDLNFYVLCISALWLLFGAFYWELPAVFRQLRTVFLSGMLANAFVTAGLASICDRFPSRVVWMLVLLALLQLVLVLIKKENTTE